LSFASLWGLDRSVQYLNHGSFGACPTAVLESQTRLRREMESEPVDFLSITLPLRLQRSRERLAAFLGTNSADLVFVPNTTTGVNAVLQSIVFEPGDEILVTSQGYAACLKAVEVTARKAQARVVIAPLSFPVSGDDEVLATIRSRLSPRTRLAVLDHVTSPTALILPLTQLVRELNERGVDTLVDGAHAPGMLALDLTRLGATYYVGNAHKWLCAPKGAAFLYARSDRQAHLHAGVIGHGYGQGWQAEFDWPGTFDPTPWLCVADSLEYLEGLLPGGWPQILVRNHDLAVRARRLLLDHLGLDPPCPDAMIGSMASLPLPAARPGSPAAGLDSAGLRNWFRARGTELWVYPQPVPLIRISAALYNDLGQFQMLAALLEEMMRGA
jgi:isopenicillin-N epimerase